MKIQFIGMVCATILFIGCGYKAAGDRCELSTVGASECGSSVCVKAVCNTGKTIAVCAGDPCADSCGGGGDQCVQFNIGNYCIPTAACTP